MVLLVVVSARRIDDQYGDGSEVLDDLVVPENSSNWEKSTAMLSAATVERLKQRLPPKYVDERSLCYCSYSPEVCGGFDNGTCLKFTEAACFYFAKKVYDKTVGDYTLEENYGCAPLTLGSGGSYLTCYANLAAHDKLMAIECCYEGSYCNANLNITEFPHFPRVRFKPLFGSIPASSIVATILLIAAVAALCLVCFKIEMKFPFPSKKATSLVAHVPNEKSAIMSSGSGSGCACLNEKTVACCLEVIGVIGCGRYGEVKKAYYKGDRIVAVKSFFTKDEGSWKNEARIYQTCMLNHENILRFVAVDITVEEFITKFILLTDYHELGSLYEYMQSKPSLGVLEALKLAESAACGLEHLHSRIRGTGKATKPSIAHRDIKLKNILVKRENVCCISDFGLAVSEDDVNSGKTIKIEVGTKRYMAPEILSRKLNPQCFYDFLMADVYSFSLVIWELLHGTQEITNNVSSGDSGIGSSGSGSKTNGINPQCSPSALPNSRNEHNVEGSQRKVITAYSDLSSNDPSLEEMRRLVCEQKRRPMFNELLLMDHILNELSCKTAECWDENINARPQIMCIRRALSKAVNDWEQRKLQNLNGTETVKAINLN